MFDIGASELLMIVIVAVVVIGPKDMPAALRTAGRWVGQMRRLSSQFRSSLDSMVREAELEDMERKWREQNEAIMRGTPQPPSAIEMQPSVGSGSEASVPEAAGDVTLPQAVEVSEPKPSQLPPPPP